MVSKSITAWPIVVRLTICWSAIKCIFNMPLDDEDVVGFFYFNASEKGKVLLITQDAHTVWQTDQQIRRSVREHSNKTGGSDGS